MAEQLTLSERRGGRPPAASSPSPQALLDELTRSGAAMTGVPQAALILGYDQRTVRTAIERGDVPATRVANSWRIPVTWLRRQVYGGR